MSNQQIFQREYFCQWVEEEYSYFKIASRLAAIDYILETEDFDNKYCGPYFGRSCGYIRNAIKIKNRIKETNDWKIVWPFILQYRDNWSLESLREERVKLDLMLKGKHNFDTF